MNIRALVVSALSVLPTTAIAAAPSAAYQAGYKAGWAVGQALPFVVGGIVAILAVGLIMRARSRSKRSRNRDPQA